MGSRQGVLVLCTGNSCRSQMAEAFLRLHGADRVTAWSAGTEPADAVHPLTVEVMKEAGVDLAEARPTHLSDYLGHAPVHTLITVCDGAARSCPTAWPGVYQRLNWPFEDPARFEGSDEETLAKFREVRDAIERRVREWLDGADGPPSIDR